MKIQSPDQRLCVIAFNHHALTAQPLFDIWRAMISHIRKLTITDSLLSKEEFLDRQTGSSILKQIAQEFQSLVRARNNIIHAAWYIGWANDEDQDFSDLQSSKYAAGKSGLEVVKKPQKQSEMEEYIKKFVSIKSMIDRVNGVASNDTRKFSENFIFHDGVYFSPDDPVHSLRDAASL